MLKWDVFLKKKKRVKFSLKRYQVENFKSIYRMNFKIHRRFFSISSFIYKIQVDSKLDKTVDYLFILVIS